MLIGDGGTGKTSLIRRFVENRFSEDYITSIGVDFLKKDVIMEGDIKVTLVLWDIAGQSKYASFKRAYYQGADFIIIVFDITQIKSYENIAKWLTEAQAILGAQICFAILANKADLKKHRQIKDYKEYRKHETLVDIVETSAKTGRNVDDVFLKIAKYLLKRGGILVD